MIKNMMGMLMEDLTKKQSGAREVVQIMSTCLTQTNEQCHNLEANFNWQQYTIASGVEDMVGGGNAEMQGMVNNTSAVADKSTTPERENAD